MKPEEQRIAIAESVGYQIVEIPTGIIVYKPNETAGFGYCVGERDDPKILEILPDYLHDLNAMHEAEKWLIEDDQHVYGCYCIDLQEEYGNTVHLTAAQRAEAFLKTIGKWTTNLNEQ